MVGLSFPVADAAIAHCMTDMLRGDIPCIFDQGHVLIESMGTGLTSCLSLSNWEIALAIDQLHLKHCTHLEVGVDDKILIVRLLCM